MPTTYDVHEGRSSWHQLRVGLISAAVTSGFKTREEAEAYQARLAEHHPEIQTFIVERVGFLPFETWDAVLEHVGAHGSIYYHAPMDSRPVLVPAKRTAHKVYVYRTRAADGFWADSGHLDRMRRKES